MDFYFILNASQWESFDSFKVLTFQQKNWVTDSLFKRRIQIYNVANRYQDISYSAIADLQKKSNQQINKLASLLATSSSVFYASLNVYFWDFSR